MKVLVVDDSLFARANICSVLQEAGFETLEAGDGQQGLEAATRSDPDLIFTDLLMPVLDGIGFLEALQEKGSETPVFVLTADIQEAKRKRCLELGVAGFLSKPLRKKDLLEAIAAFPRKGTAC